MSLLNSDSGMAGLYRGKLIIYENEIRVYIPAINKVCNPFNTDGTLNIDIYNENKFSFLKPEWCTYNLDISQLSQFTGLVWIMFEGGDAKYPVIINYDFLNSSGIGIDNNYQSNNSSNNVFIDRDYKTNWIIKWNCTVYGNSEKDDNGICGWGGCTFKNKNYRLIKGCHVAIPMDCITGKGTEFPEFVNKYGTVLELKNPTNNKTVVAVVADCGNFGPKGKYNHHVALDLPPNTQNALNIHGTHVIHYRVIGNISSWDGSQLLLSQFENAQ